MSLDQYQEFLARKQVTAADYGFDPDCISSFPFDFQAYIIRWALRKGRAAIWADCGLGKSCCELEWAHQLVERTGGNVLLLTPLVVTEQMQAEACKFGIEARIVRRQSEVKPGISITNYEMLHEFEPNFAGVIADESSILKNSTGFTCQQLVEFASRIPYRLAATATPAPNDTDELGNHAEFLGVMSRSEMMAEFFVHDGGNTSEWRLKGHARDVFWRFVASWAITLRNPSDIGFSNDGYVLPSLNQYEHVVDFYSESSTLLDMEAEGLNEQRRSKRDSLEVRVQKVAELVAAKPNAPWVIWGELNDECNALEAAIPGAVQIAGSDKPAAKVDRLKGFVDGRYRVLVTKGDIARFGLNWQHCSDMVFASLTHSYETVYQCIRRCYRFRQANPVNVHFVYAPAEAPILRNLRRKEQQARIMIDEMVGHVSQETHHGHTRRIQNEYTPSREMKIPAWLKEEKNGISY